jgi:hypothetical protein
LLIVWKTDAAIGDVDLHESVILRRHRQVAFVHVVRIRRLAGVEHEIQEHSLQLYPVAIDARECRGEMGSERDAPGEEIAALEAGDISGDVVRSGSRSCSEFL